MLTTNNPLPRLNFKTLCKRLSLVTVAVFILPVAALVFTSLVKATDPATLTPLAVQTCTGSGDLYLYQGADPFQEIDTTFQVQRDRLLIFNKRPEHLTSLQVEVNGSPVTPTVVSQSTTAVKVYQVQTTPGDTVHVTGTTSPASYRARVIQGYLAQDAASPVYDISTLQFILDDDQSNDMFLSEGTYSYVFFDKYTENAPGQGSDNRLLHVTITGPAGTVADQTYTQPSPVGTQGAVVGSYTVTAGNSGLHTLSLDTEDSIYWPLVQCPQKGQIIVKKVTVPTGEAQSFNFNASYGHFSLSDGQEINSGLLDPGVYSVTEIVPAGWELASATCDDGSPVSAIELAANETVTCTFANNKLTPQHGSITGCKINDLNKDSSYDTGEPTIPGWGISLYTQQDTVNPYATTVTGTDGCYEFADLPFNTYTVVEENRSGWTQTYPHVTPYHTVNVVLPSEYNHIDFL
ncbi:MAG: SdrD B-like domain-containing protein, partial [Candidatus Veblenbacteria bacterium]|nr:SdrD B-like domain-containing protein [Candidatus Veblenbacteria bacterium]